MIKHDKIEYYITEDTIRATVRITVEKHYSMEGMNPRDRYKIQWAIMDKMKNDIIRKIYGQEAV